MTQAEPSSVATEVLATSDLCYRYEDGTLAIQNVNVKLGQGEVVSIVGPSGCGKTTLLRCLAGIEEASSGQVERSVPSQRNGPDAGTALAVVFQKDTLLPWRTVEQNVAFGLRYLPLNRAEKAERIGSLLRLAGLTDSRKRYPYQLSGGMRRRTAFLTSVAVYPRILLLDEPFSGLDEPTKLDVLGSVMAIVRELDMSVLLVTHDLGEAVSVSDRVYILTRGPGTVADEHRVAMPKDLGLVELRETDAYARSYQRLWHSLRLQISDPGTFEPESP